MNTKQHSSSNNKQGNGNAASTTGANSRKNGGKGVSNNGDTNGSSAPGTLGLKVYQSVGKPSPLTTSASLKIMKASTS